MAPRVSPRRKHKFHGGVLLWGRVRVFLWVIGQFDVDHGARFAMGTCQGLLYVAQSQGSNNGISEKPTIYDFLLVVS